MNRTLLLFLLLLGLGGLTYWLVTRGAAPETRSLTWEREFKVPAEDIYRIFLYNRNTDTRTTLERRDGRWYVNDTHPVNPNIIQNFLGVLSTLQISYVPGEAAVLPAARAMATQGVYVQLFGRDGEPLKSYTIGGNTSNSQGTYALIDGSEQPQVVSLPFFSGNVRSLYAIHGDAWRDKALFDFDPARVTALSIDYPKQRSRAFTLRRQDDGFTVEPLYPTTQRRGDRPAPGSAEQLLDKLTAPIAEAIINENPDRRDINATIPFAVFRIELQDQEDIVAQVWPQLSEDVNGKLKTTEYERYYIERTRGAQRDFLAAQQRVIGPLFRDYGYFFGS